MKVKVNFHWLAKSEFDLPDWFASEPGILCHYVISADFFYILWQGGSSVLGGYGNNTQIPDISKTTLRYSQPWP